MGFSILSKTLVNQGNNTALRNGLFEAQTLSYRKILKQFWRDELLPDIMYIPPNIYYNVLKSNFDDWDAVSVSEQLARDDDLTKAVSSFPIKPPCPVLRVTSHK